MTTTFKIKFYGSGLQAGIGKITEKVYDFWKDSEHILEATDPNEVFDYEAIGVTSKELKLKDFWGYVDVVKFDGLLLGSFHIEVLNNESEVVISVESDQLSALRKSDFLEDYVEELDEFYSDSDLGKGCYISWTREGDGLWFTGEIEIFGTGFDLENLRFNTVDFEGESYVTQILYRESALTNFESSIRWGDPAFEFIKVEGGARNAKAWEYALY